jgi:hypothetical protein
LHLSDKELAQEVARRKAEAEFVKHHAVAEKQKDVSNAAIAKLLAGKPKGPLKIPYNSLYG